MASEARRGAAGRLVAAVRPEEWIALAYVLAVGALFVFSGLPLAVVEVGREYAKFLIAILVVSLPIWLGFRLLELRRRKLDRRAALADLTELARALAAYWLTLIAYTNLKSRLVTFHPRLFDETFRDLDALLHFGGGDFLAWTLSFTHDPAWTQRWALVYFFAWAALALPFGVAFARGGGRAARRVLGSLTLLYAAGSLIYLALPALGPGFAFRPLFAHLGGSTAWAVQESMLRGFLHLTSHPEASAAAFAGLAAFPSLHLATTGVGLLAAWRWAKPLLLLLVPWNLAIAWSALYFGWHYAIDFYPGLLLAAGAWWVMGRFQGQRS